jgi:hypothetical protein
MINRLKYLCWWILLIGVVCTFYVWVPVWLFSGFNILDWLIDRIQV